jgi:hypothetical protein
LVAAEIYVVMIKLQPSFSTLQETFLLVHAWIDEWKERKIRPWQPGSTQ